MLKKDLSRLIAGARKSNHMEREGRCVCATVARTSASLSAVRENADPVCVHADQACTAVPATAEAAQI